MVPSLCALTRGQLLVHLQYNTNDPRSLLQSSRFEGPITLRQKRMPRSKAHGPHKLRCHIVEVAVADRFSIFIHVSKISDLDPFPGLKGASHSNFNYLRTLCRVRGRHGSQFHSSSTYSILFLRRSESAYAREGTVILPL
jgi:hypothetical protein